MRENENRCLEGKPTLSSCQIQIHLTHHRKTNIGRVLESILDALLASGVVEDERNIDAIFIRVARGAREGAVKATVTPHRTPR